jgi:hypothetical protein
MEIMAFDSHKRYTLARVERTDGQLLREERINHCRGNIAGCLGKFETGGSVTVETIGNRGCFCLMISIILIPLLCLSNTEYNSHGVY